MKISLNAQAELELVEGSACYARKANAQVAEAFISEFDRSAFAAILSAARGSTPTLYG